MFTSYVDKKKKKTKGHIVFPVFTITVNVQRVKNETPARGQVVLAEMNVILCGYNECDGI